MANNSADASKGAANADLSLLRALRERGHAVEDHWEIGEPRKIRHDNLHLLIEAPRSCEREVIHKLDKTQFDVVLVNQPLGWRTARSLARRATGPLFVARSHGWEPRVFTEQRPYLGRDKRGWLRTTASDVLRPFLHRQNELVLRWADGIVVCSKDDRDYILTTSDIPERKVLAMPPGLPPEFLRSPAPSLTADRCRRLLYVGQYALFKGPSVVAAAMVQTLERRPDVSATWVCAASDHPRVRALFPEVIQHRITLLDWMPRETLLRIYDAHGIYLFPSFFEGFAQTFLEAMARGLAVLATRVDGMAQAIRNGENGYLFERGCPTEMADVAISLIDDQVDLVRLGREARRTAADYTWDRSAGMFENFVGSLRRPASQVRH